MKTILTSVLIFTTIALGLDESKDFESSPEPNKVSGIHHTGRAARPLPSNGSMVIEDVVQLSVDFHVKTNVVISPNGTYGYEAVRDKPEKESRVTDYTLRIAIGDRGYLIKMEGIYGGCEAKWISEKLIFIRADWARHWGADYIFDVESGRIIYEEGYQDEWAQQQKSEPAATASESKPVPR